MKKKDILIISFTYIHRDIRVYRQIQCLRKLYNVSVIGLSDPELPSVKFISCLHVRKYPPFVKNIERFLGVFKLLLNMHERYYWTRNYVKESKNWMLGLDVSLIIANDLDSLPLALSYKKNAAVIFDAHEYYPREREESIVWRMLYRGYNKYLCKRYIQQADRMITVNSTLSGEYSKEYGVEPVVVNNAGYYVDVQPSPIGGKIKIVHHGGAVEGRKLENMIAVMNYLDDRYEMDMYLVPTHRDYLDRLIMIINGNKALKGRVTIREAVPMDKLVKVLNTYDIGIYLLEPSNFNQRYALPNKIFDYIQARLAIAVGPSPEMKNIVDKNRIGVVSEEYTPESLARIISEMSVSSIMEYKKNADSAAKKICFEKNSEILRKIVASAMREKEENI